MSFPIRIFISYAHEDLSYKDNLTKHLSGLKYNGLIEEWNDQQILAGQDWDNQIKTKIVEADIILLLISADFMASDYIYDVELKEAFRRHEADEVIVVPIIIRSCHWKSLPIKKFQALPAEGNPVANWANHDDAYYDVVTKLELLIREKLGAGSFNVGRAITERAASTSEYHKISCNRTEVITHFWRNFIWKEDKEFPTHFYFLIGKPYGQANSLVKRIITELSHDRDHVKYQGFEEVDPIRIKTNGTESLNDLQLDLRRVFNQFLGLKRQVKNMKDLVKNIDPHYTKLKKYRILPIAIELKITLKCWDLNVSKAIQWFINKFAQLDKDSQLKLVFFLIVNIQKKDKKKKGGLKLFSRRSASNPTENGATSKLREFIEKIEQATLLPSLVKVSKDDLDDWYKKYEKNEKERQEKVNTLVRKLPGNEPWDMSDVEVELKDIVESYQNKNFSI